MKSIVNYISILGLCLIFSSCLKSGLDDLPAYSDAEITNMKFEYRWIDDVNGNEQMQVVQMSVENTIDDDAGTIDSKITVPDASADFSDDIRQNVELSNLVGYADISLAAVITPLNGAPTFGGVADFSDTPVQYEVVAADGTSKIWTLTISEFNK